MPHAATEQDQEIQVLTGDGVRFSLTLAGLYRRFLAWLIDGFVVMALSYITRLLLSLFLVISADLAGALQMLVLFLISFGYRICLEYIWDGKTVGKHVMNIYVMSLELTNLGFYQVVIRNLVRVVDSMPIFYGVGGLTCFLHPRNQRLGDLAGNTVVIYSPDLAEPNVRQFTEDYYNSFSEHPHIEARLRKKTCPEEGRVALQALLRRDRLDPNERVSLFKELAEHFQEKVSFPDETTFGLTPEQYVRNVVDTLYRQRGSSANRQKSESGENR